MRSSYRALLVLALAIVPMLVLPVLATAQTAPAATGPVTMEWLGWSHFRFTTSAGTVVLVNPFTANPDSPVTAADMTKADLIFAADGHGDEIGSTVEIAQATGATVFAPGELGSWLVEQGVPRAQVVQFAAPGDRIQVKDVTARMVESVHSSGLPRPSATVPYGGIAAGLFLTFGNGYTVYFAGSSAAMAEQALWAEMYKPHLVILHMFVRHDPVDFAMQARLLETGNRNIDAVMPHHHRAVQAQGTTSVADVQAAMREMGVRTRLVAPQIGVSYTLVPPR
jgi:L-ascorbate metabolism protein UlaG (beta-lactamase superfamily)